ncbi:MAG: hypothetical protein KDC98_19020, partial [Planctomycetes bacterium]|nr:hypothetical protein [Planctomycetota bacterium]
IPGQDFYYWPAGTTSEPFLVYDYGSSCGNLAMVPCNPTGGTRFIAAVGVVGAAVARAQRDLGFGYGAGPWTFGTDLCVRFPASIASGQDIAMLSLEPAAGSESFVMRAVRGALTTGYWTAEYTWYDASGLPEAGAVPDPGFQNLLTDRWYRWETDVDFSTNRITQLRLTDLVTSTTVRYVPPLRFLNGGIRPGASPFSFRFSSGSALPGNLAAFDNPFLRPGQVFRRPEPQPGPCTGPCCHPANSFTVDGWPQLGTWLDLTIDAPGSGLSGGYAFLLFATGVGPLPCGQPLLHPGGVNNLLIDPATTNSAIVGLWSPSQPVTTTLALPVGPPAFLGVRFYMQGLVTDLASILFLTEGRDIVIGG